MPRFATIDNRYASIDIGTNSTKMTAAEVSGGRIDVLAEHTEITRLGRGVDATKRFSDDAVAATLDAIRRYVAEARSLGISHIAAGGTSAMRESTNGDEFRRTAAEIIGADVEVVSGPREAQLTFLGAMSDASLLQQASRVLAFDVGGGSTELIVGTRSRIERSESLDIGAVRLTERILRSDPPTSDEMATAQAQIDSVLSAFMSTQVDRIIGIGGTATTVAAMLSPRFAAIQGGEVRDRQLADLTARLASEPLEQRRSTPGLDPARADVIVAGMLIVRRIMACFDKASYVVSTRGVRYGMLLEMSEGRKEQARV
jgi:exopolyphosphatase / guanosine-5'-triphosphate,3'-diphosphate pyrophosphatase